MTEQNRQARVREIPKVEKVLKRELEHFYEWYRALQVKPMIRALRLSFEEIGRQEAERHAKKFSSERETLERFAGTLINKLLHHPTLRIKQLDQESGDGLAKLAAIQDLFELHVDPPADTVET